MILTNGIDELIPTFDIFQTIYFLLFINVNYPANVQIVFMIFALTDFDFIDSIFDSWLKAYAGNFDQPIKMNEIFSNGGKTGVFLIDQSSIFLLWSTILFSYLILKLSVNLKSWKFFHEFTKRWI